MQKTDHGSRTLYNGNHSDYGSQSEADFALLSSLAFWTGRDAGKMETLFRNSGLFREDKSSLESYLKTSIANAISGCEDIYEGKKMKEQKQKDRYESTMDLVDEIVSWISIEKKEFIEHPKYEQYYEKLINSISEIEGAKRNKVESKIKKHKKELGIKVTEFFNEG